MRWITPTLAIVAALAIGLFGGILIGHNTSASAQTRAGAFARNFNGTPGTGGRTGGAGGGFAAGDFASGTIVSISGDSIVIKSASGTEQTISTSTNTKVTKTSTSSVSALKAGQTVTIVGTRGSSGNLTASSVSEGANVLRGGFGAGRGPGGSNAPTP